MTVLRSCTPSPRDLNGHRSPKPTGCRAGLTRVECEFHEQFIAGQQKWSHIVSPRVIAVSHRTQILSIQSDPSRPSDAVKDHRNTFVRIEIRRLLETSAEPHLARFGAERFLP